MHFNKEVYFCLGNKIKYSFQTVLQFYGKKTTQIGLAQGLEKYGDQLQNVYVYDEKDVLIGSWKEEEKQMETD